MRQTTWATIFVYQEFVMNTYLNHSISEDFREEDPYIFKYRRMNGVGFALGTHPTGLTVQIGR